MKYLPNLFLYPGGISKLMPVVIGLACLSFFLFQPVFSNLKTDQLYFLQCAYSAVNFDEFCHYPSMLNLLLEVLISSFGLVKAALLYKLMSLVILLVMTGGMIFVIQEVTPIKNNVRHQFFSILLASCSVYYIATVRGAEVRPELLGNFMFFLGALGLFFPTRRHFLSIQVSFLQSIIFLSLAALFSVRLIAPAVMLGISMLFLQLDRQRDAKSFIKTTLIVAVTLSILLAVIHFFIFDIFEFFSTALSMPATEAGPESSLQRSLFSLGIAMNFSGTPYWWETLLSLVALPIRPFLQLLAFICLVILIVKSRGLVRCSRISLLFLLAIWFLQLCYEYSPHAYVVSCETTILFVVFATFFSSVQGEARLWIGRALICTILIAAVFSLLSNLKIRNYNAVQMLSDTHSLPDFYSMDDAALISNFTHRSILYQMESRVVFCQRYREFLFVGDYKSHPLCLRDEKSSDMWFRQENPEIAIQSMSSMNVMTNLKLSDNFIAENKFVKLSGDFYIKRQ